MGFSLDGGSRLGSNGHIPSESMAVAHDDDRIAEYEIAKAARRDREERLWRTANFLAAGALAWGLFAVGAAISSAAERQHEDAQNQLRATIGGK